MNLKIQLPKAFSLNAHVKTMTSTKTAAEQDLVTTFHAYSDTMKARVLEAIAQGEEVIVKPTDDEPRDGEWLEKRMS